MAIAAQPIRHAAGIAVLICGVLSASKASAVVDAAETRRCTSEGGRIQVIGLPEHYRQAETASRSCWIESYGSDYQILDWFENGKLDAAVLSPFALTLLAERDLGEVSLEETRAGRSDDAARPESGAGWQRFLEELIVETDGGAYGVSLHRHGYALRYYRYGESRSDARRALKGYLQQPGDVRLPPVYLSSHLSPGLPILIREVAASLGIPIATEDTSAASQWQRLIAGLRFTVAGRPPAPAAAEEFFVVEETQGACGAGPHCLVPGTVQDLIVRPREGGLPPTPAEIEALARRLVTWNEYLCPSCIERLSAPLREFQLDNYTPHIIGSRRQRHYRFTIDELWTILREKEGRNDNLALVLTGGGVKAAYQTQVIEELYSKGYLYNVMGEAMPREDPTRVDALSVDYVIGTSGGALLGVFVSALSGPPGQLVERLWGGEGSEMDSTDVFPFVEMLRYASVLASVLLFALLCAVALRIPATRRHLLAERSSPADEGRGTRYWRLAIPWTVLLFAAPWLIKYVNGAEGLEHVPGVAGLFYTAYIAMAVYSDNVLRFGGDGEPQRRLVYPWMLLLGGLAVALAPLFYDPESAFRSGFHHVPGLGGITAATLTTCIGLLLMGFGVSGFAACRAQREPWGGGRLLCGTLVLLTVPLLAYLLLVATRRPLFELTGAFWLWLCLYSLLLGAGVLFIARPLSERVRRGFDFLFEYHPAETFLLRLRRYSRALLFFTAAWLWWNFVNAPALYGNETAKAHFNEVVRSVAEDDCGIRFQTAFVISATSLDAAREVYFYAYPREIVADAEGIAELNVRNDPRWVEFGPAVRREDLVSIAFASGSPFPVFPMTRVSAPPLATNCEEAALAGRYDPDRRENQWLVDGGYAHNIPIDAARQLGAERVLVLSSSPLHTKEGVGSVSNFSISRLIIGLPRLFPYLFQRSQIEDVLGTEGILVTAISPPPTVENWPALTDFRPARIRQTVEEAQKNITLGERVGTVESWGQPLCWLGGIEVPCEALRALGGSAGHERRAGT